MKIAKKPKKNIHKKAETPEEIVITADIFNFAVFVRILKLEHNFTEDQLAEVRESYAAYVEEVNDKRSGLWEFVNDTRRMTGIDIVNFIGLHGRIRRGKR